jgi:hypothetical protein
MPTYKADWRRMLMSMESVREYMLSDELKQDYILMKKIQRARELQGILTYYPYEIIIN